MRIMGALGYVMCEQWDMEYVSVVSWVGGEIEVKSVMGVKSVMNVMGL